MDAVPAIRPRLSVLGQTYVAMVAVLAAISTVAHDPAWSYILVALSLPLSLLALWVGLYAGLAVGFAVGHDAARFPWEVALVWILVWTATAWLNAHVAEKIVHRGWSALSVGSPADLDDD
jgi:uncharacterized membrane protein SpoIIM required for sporulation